MVSNFRNIIFINGTNTNIYLLTFRAELWYNLNLFIYVKLTQKTDLLNLTLKLVDLKINICLCPPNCVKTETIFIPNSNIRSRKLTTAPYKNWRRSNLIWNLNKPLKKCRFRRTIGAYRRMSILRSGYKSTKCDITHDTVWALKKRSNGF